MGAEMSTTQAAGTPPEPTYIVIDGTPLEGYTHHGPFNTWEDACEWAEQHRIHEWYALELAHPEKGKPWPPNS